MAGLSQRSLGFDPGPFRLRFCCGKSDTGSGVPRNFGWGGGQQIQLRTEDRQNGDLGAVAASQGFWRQL